MKKLLACFIAPLMMLLLSSFTQPPVKKQVPSKDSTNIINVQFSPAQLILDDQRSTDMYKGLMENGLKESLIATSIDSVRKELVRVQRERREDSWSAKASSWLNMDEPKIIKQYNKAISFQRWLYILYGVLLILFLIEVSSASWKNVLTSQNLLLLLPLVLWMAAVYLLIHILVNNILFPWYEPIRHIINNPPG